MDRFAVAAFASTSRAFHFYLFALNLRTSAMDAHIKRDRRTTVYP